MIQDSLGSNLIDARTLLTRSQDQHPRLFDCRFSLVDPRQGPRAYLDGHLPGALHANLDEHLSSPIGPRTGRHPLPEPSRLAAWLGGCGWGVNACNNLLAMEVAGFHGSRLYAGSWSEWIRSAERPVAVGAG